MMRTLAIVKAAVKKWLQAGPHGLVRGRPHRFHDTDPPPSFAT